MANRTSGKDRLIQITLGETQQTLDNGQYSGQIYKHDLLGRLVTGLIDQAGPSTPLFEGVAQDDALSTADPAEKLRILRKGAFKATVQSTDAAAIAARGFRIKGSGTSNGLVAADRMKAVYAEDSLTLTVQPVPGLPKCGYIARLDSYGTSGAGECVVVLDADWARAGFDESDLDSEADPRIQSVDFGGIDIGSRLTLVERFEQRPHIATSIDPSTAADPSQAEIDLIFGANRNFEVAGTNMTAALVTFSGDQGGIIMTTAGADNDQAILQPRTNPANVTRWNAGFDSRQGIRWATSFQVDAITSILIKVGLALTNALDVGTDADQVGLFFETDSGDKNFAVIKSIAGTDSEDDSGVAVAADTEYRVVFDVGRDGVCRTFINDVLVDTSSALTDVATLKPFMGIQQLAGSITRAMRVRFQAISMDHAA